MSTSEEITLSKKTFWFLLLLALSLPIGIWVWKDVQLKNVHHLSDLRTEDMLKEMTLLKKEEQKHALQMFMQPFVWAVRNEWLKNNRTDLQFLAEEVVKKKGFQYVIITDQKGNIVVSTNKKWQGKPFSASGIEAELKMDSMQIFEKDSSLLVAQSPVTGFNRKLGSVVVTYEIQ